MRVFKCDITYFEDNESIRAAKNGKNVTSFFKSY